jgi:uncharacterized membrane protein YgcG
MKSHFEEDGMNSKKLTPHILMAAFVLALAVIGYSAEDIVQSKWAVQPPIIDGLDTEWAGAEMIFEKKAGVDYAIRNDAQNMYVLFVFNNPKYLSNINMTGFTLYYNLEGKKKKTHAFHFSRTKLSGEELIAYLKKRGEVLTEQQMQAIDPQKTYSVFMTERTGKKDEDIAVTAPIPGVLNPGFKIDRKGEAFIYEFVIPLIKSETSPRGMGVEPGQSLKLGFEWGGMTEALMKRLSAGGGGGDASGEGRAGSVIDSTRGGRSRGGSGGAPRSASGRMPKKYAFWIDVRLAQNQ